MNLTERDLMQEIGPAPTVKETAEFLRESVPSTWRRLQSGELERIDLAGITRVSLSSIAKLLNSSTKYEMFREGRGTHRRKP